MKIGIDLGGTKIEAIVLGENSEVLVRERVATPQGDYSATLDAIVCLINQCRKSIRLGSEKNSLNADFDQIGVGSPGSLEPETGRMRNSNSTCINGRAIKEDLERMLGRNVVLENDANCFALGEAAGEATALRLRNNVAYKDVEIDVLRGNLKARGAVVDPS